MREKVTIIVLFIVTSLIIILIPNKGNEFIKSGKLYISEISANNNSVFDNLKETSDYIELYNGYNYDINLDGYYISDSEFETKKWQFPDIKIKAKDYLIIYASNLDNCDNNICHTNFKLSSRGEIVTLSDSNGNIISKVKYPKLDIDVTYSYVDSKYILTNQTPNKKNDNKEYIKEKIDYNLKINEYMIKNNRAHYDKYGNYYDWVEIYNSGDSVSLKNIYISDDKRNLEKYKLPDIIINKEEYAVIYLTKDKVDYEGLYVPMGLSIKDSIIISCDKKIIDSVDVTELKDDMSYGLKDGIWKYFLTSTPGKSNNTSAFDKVGDMNGNS